ncbi:unnamed protein product [Orchesella dallaii]|uniref:Ionotropic glutamate receptor C-terminal domain-containing protein n=1 Tax=Orchesella dallaii TaxID=48710 RepID=A0ABP1S394_9HEXA
MMPFSWDLWLTIGIFIVFIYFLGNLFSFIYFRKKHRPFLKLTTKRRNSTGIWMLAAITQRGYHKFLRIKHAKILVFTTLMTSQVVYVGYTSSMCSILSVDVIPIKKFKNFENHFKLYVDKYVPTIYYRIEWLRNMSLLNIPATQILKSEAIPLILSTSSALVTTADEFYPAFRQYSVSSQDNSACEKIDSVTSDGFYIQQGMFVKPGSPFREHFNIKLLLIRERGLQTRYLNKYFEASTLRCLDLKHSFFNTISFQDVVTAFVFLLLVYLLSLIALVIEVCQSRKRRIVYAI